MRGGWLVTKDCSTSSAIRVSSGYHSRTQWHPFSNNLPGQTTREGDLGDQKTPKLGEDKGIDVQRWSTGGCLFYSDYDPVQVLQKAREEGREGVGLEFGLEAIHCWLPAQGLLALL